MTEDEQNSVTLLNGFSLYMDVFSQAKFNIAHHGYGNFTTFQGFHIQKSHFPDIFFDTEIYSRTFAAINFKADEDIGNGKFTSQEDCSK